MVKHTVPTGTLNRRDMLQGMLGTAAWAGLAGNGLTQAAPAERPPNVVLIISDDQAWGDYGFMGHPHIRTPRLDRFARESVVFTRGYVAAPLCCPSLASMITGLHPHQHTVTGNDPAPTADGPRWGPIAKWPEERQAKRREIVSRMAASATLPRLLATAGYRSFQCGKWWHGHYSNGGFDEGMTHGDINRGGRHGDAGLQIGRETMAPLFDFIDSHSKAPFFVWYAPFMPHTPHNPPKRLLDQYRDKTPSLHIAKYWAMCEWFDETCGQLLDHLEGKDLRENTMVLYIADNGWIQRPDAPRYAPRSKQSPYEGGIRTPIMVRWPGRARPQRDERTLVSAVDLAPTILAAAGLSPRDDMQGVNLLDGHALARRDAVFATDYQHNMQDVDRPAASLETRIILHERWKLLVHQPDVHDPAIELYDILADPHEKTDLAPANPDVVRDLRTRLDTWYNPPA